MIIPHTDCNVEATGSYPLSVPLNVTLSSNDRLLICLMSAPHTNLMQLSKKSKMLNQTPVSEKQNI